MIDFDRLVIRVGMDTFARLVTVYPIVSQPEAAPYPARAIWSSKPVEVQTEDGAVLSSQEHSITIRVAEFDVLPRQGDKILIDAAGSYRRVGMCLVEDARDEDGQGSKSLTLKVIGP